MRLMGHSEKLLTMLFYFSIIMLNDLDEKIILLYYVHSIKFSAWTRYLFCQPERQGLYYETISANSTHWGDNLAKYRATFNPFKRQSVFSKYSQMKFWRYKQDKSHSKQTWQQSMFKHMGKHTDPDFGRTRPRQFSVLNYFTENIEFPLAKIMSNQHYFSELFMSCSHHCACFRILYHWLTRRWMLASCCRISRRWTFNYHTEWGETG